MRPYGMPRGSTECDSCNLTVGSRKRRNVETELSDELIGEGLASRFANECDAGTCAECNPIVDDEDVLSQEWLQADGIYFDERGNTLHYEASDDE